MKENTKWMICAIVAMTVIVAQSYVVISQKNALTRANASIKATTNSEATQVMRLIDQIRNNKADWKKQETIIQEAQKKQDIDNQSTSALNDQLVKHWVASLAN